MGLVAILLSFLLSLVAWLVSKIIDNDKFTDWLEIWMETNRDFSYVFRIATPFIVLAVTIANLFIA